MSSYFSKLRRWAGRPKLLKQTRPVIVDDTKACESPIFLIGCHRSGTSMVRRIFNAHRDIACPPETFFLEHYVSMLENPQVASGFMGFGYDREAMRGELRRQARRMHEAFRLAEGKRLWADKTPQYTAIVDGLRDLFGPGARFVMIYRHPFDVVASIYEKGWSFLNEFDDPFEDTVSYVARSQTAMLRFETANPDVSTRIDYETLNADPESTLKRVMRDLGEDFDPAMLHYNDQSHNFGIEDLIVRSQGGFVYSGGWWRKSWTKAQYDTARTGLMHIMTDLGYELPALNGGAE